MNRWEVTIPQSTLKCRLRSSSAVSLSTPPSRQTDDWMASKFFDTTLASDLPVWVAQDWKRRRCQSHALNLFYIRWRSHRRMRRKEPWCTVMASVERDIKLAGVLERKLRSLLRSILRGNRSFEPVFLQGQLSPLTFVASQQSADLRCWAHNPPDATTYV